MYIMHGMHIMRIKKTVSCTFTIPTVREKILSNDGTFRKNVIMKEILKNEVKYIVFHEIYFTFLTSL